MDCSHLAECVQSIERTQEKYAGCEILRCLKCCDTRSTVVVEENKKKYVLQNSGDVIAVYQVDGAMITSADTVRCDHMIVNATSLITILVELKGTDLRHAFRQIENTYNRIMPALRKYRVFGRIVTSTRTNVPNIKTDPRYKALQKKFMMNGGNLRTGTNSISEHMKELD